MKGSKGAPILSAFSVAYFKYSRWERARARAIS
jgi:hypothetical protein